jgi:hypothetical protein
MSKNSTEKKSNDKSEGLQNAGSASGVLPKPVTYYRIAEVKLFSRSYNFLMEFLKIKKEKERFQTLRKQNKYLPNKKKKKIKEKIYSLQQQN